MSISLIVAFSENRVIGCKGKIPWNIPGEQSRFKELTTGNVVIMGRHTFEEIGIPLPNRYTILVSKTMKYESPICVTVPTLSDALTLAGDREVFISGGEKIYREALEMGVIDKMFITIVHKEFCGETFFPDFHKERYRETYRRYFKGEIPYTYLTLEALPV
ncbi:dihydrofolate reductase [Hathewaya proteolytica DSM 3090]|uniref:Dihydrofolate reductase n=1 Tax=Hathewaya proteolytica DSM 3090 TaxID=1121331 RepID=A0A1M6PRK9_9CLOT|nr:dihydrofolate reductase [Hathewaya proteolytica]SHK10566.1 dihydrofolate reductase [Hathewaya proteolytica DSM 3090]